jgi:hypothetical protein
MGNVIQWADYVKALNTITQEQQMVSGMSVSEAASALNYTKTASGMYIKTVMSSTVESTAATTATEAAGAIGSEVVTTNAVNLTLVEGAGGTAEVAGIGTVALPIAACMAGAVGGYLIGKELNKNQAYSNFFSNLVYRTCDFVTGQHLADELLAEENAPTVPLLYDANGNAYLQSDMLTGVKGYLDSMSPAGSKSIAEVLSAYQLSTQLVLSSFTNAIIIDMYDYIYLCLNNADFINRDGNGIGTTGVGKMQCWTKYSKVLNWTHDIAVGEKIYSGFAPEYINFYCVKSLNVSSTNYSPNLTLQPAVTLPPVITKYTPATVATTPKTDTRGKVWKQVYLPSTNPSEMPDGEPVPTTAPDPSRLNPYIKPYQPQPNGVPVIQPQTIPTNPVVIPTLVPDTSIEPYPPVDPNIDPSQNPTGNVTPENNPIPQPNDTGGTTVPIVPPVIPPSSAKGLLHVYNPTPEQVDQFGEWLWTTFSGDLIDTIGKLFNNPMDAVIGLHELYCTPTTGLTVNIRAGFLESGVASRLVSSRYKEIKCGAISVPEYWGNYLDYSPYTKSYCYLPFIGIVELNTDDIVGSGVEITYRVDTYNGSCIALITTAKPNSDEGITYQFEGNCSVSVPITSGMLTAIQNGLTGIATTGLSAAATAAITVATGGTALPAAVMVGTVAAGATKQGLTSKNMVQHSGSFGSSFGAMGVKIPFLIIKRPRQKVVDGYNTNYGYPSHKMVLISTCTGYLRVREVNVVSPTATEAEKKMITELLKNGVYVD